MSPLAQSILLLVCSNVFMTLAWYAHLRDLRGAPVLMAVGVSWGLARFEYLWAGLRLMGAVYFTFRG